MIEGIHSFSLLFITNLSEKCPFNDKYGVDSTSSQTGLLSDESLAYHLGSNVLYLFSGTCELHTTLHATFLEESLAPPSGVDLSFHDEISEGNTGVLVRLIHFQLLRYFQSLCRRVRNRTLVDFHKRSQ